MRGREGSVWGREAAYKAKGRKCEWSGREGSIMGGKALYQGVTAVIKRAQTATFCF